MKPSTANQIAILIYFLSALIILNSPKPSLAANILGIALIIAGTYGVVTISKKDKFIF